MDATYDVLTTALLVALLIIDRFDAVAGCPGGRSEDDSGGRQGLCLKP